MKNPVSARKEILILLSLCFALVSLFASPAILQASSQLPDTQQGSTPTPPPVCGDGYCNASSNWLPYSEDALTCPQDCALYCGDAICDIYWGEDETTCPDDCILTPSPTATITPTATATRTPTPTPTASGTPDLADAQSGTTTPTALPEYTSTPELLAPVGCVLGSFAEQSAGWLRAYEENTANDYVPKQISGLEVYICQSPPVGDLCFVIYDGMLEAAEGDTARIGLADCTEDDCNVLQRAGQKRGNQICYRIRANDGIQCDEGCALALLDEPLRVGLETGTIIFIAVGGALIIIFAILLILLLVGRRKKEDDVEEETVT